METNRLLRIWQIIGCKKKGIGAIIPISRSSWLLGVKNGIYPAPIKIGKRTVVWRESDIKKILK